MEGVFGVDGQTGDFGGELVARNVAGLVAIAIETQTAQFGRGQAYRVPLQHHRCLCGIAAA